MWNNNWRSVYDYTWNEGDNWAIDEEPIAVEIPEELHKYFGNCPESTENDVRRDVYLTNFRGFFFF